ncbi:TRAP transporter substrate-binding protein [Pseudogemmobacter bohemicus]|uniref:TRAP transporter substrate-binding protein n=1 Tax=Pseudogemmobacter bohemicus TaxID=2250708 RepID=UPI000DD46D31|nr:TRAP transporter substrate-binding protein [Pseudogemmobacter bohemicus]
MLNRRQMLAMSGSMAVAMSAPSILRAAQVDMMLAHASAELHPNHIFALEFQKALETLAPGAFNIRIFPNRQLGDDKQLLESTISGAIQLSTCSGVLFPMVTGKTALNAWQLPFLVRDYDHMEKMALSDIGAQILADLDDTGIVGLGTVDIGQRNFLSTTKPVLSLADFTGLKTRIVPVPLHKEIWEKLGTAPIGLPYGEVYGALETGVLDALEINVSSILGENLWEVGKQFTLTGHYPWHAVMAVNKPVFDGLPAELQQAMRQAGRDAIPPTMLYAKTQDLEGRDALRAKGVEIHELTDLAEMRMLVEPLVSEWSAKSPLIAEFIRVAQATT